MDMEGSRRWIRGARPSARLRILLQEVRDLGVTPPDRAVESGAELARGMGVGPLVQKQPHNIYVVAVGGHEEGRGAVGRQPRVHAAPALQQCLDNVEEAARGRHVQRRGPVVRRGLVHVRAMLEQRVYYLQL